VRVVTLNTWKCDGDYLARLDAMASVLAELAPDAVALQEVFRAPDIKFDTAAHLAAALGMNVCALPLRRKRRVIGTFAVDSTSGLALLSRAPIRSSRAVPLTSDPRDGERAALIAELDGLTVAVVHFTHLADSDDLRRRQFDTVVDALATAPTVVMVGDFNAPVEVFQLGRTRFRDCRTACGLPPVPTVVNGRAEDCIDQVLVAGEWEPIAWRTVPHAYASDHFAVVADSK
jgi:endonuclease/exonuclease/phosphatase family metal-dependent hydrolase